MSTDNFRIEPDERAHLSGVIEYAHKKENWFNPRESKFQTRDFPGYRVQVSIYRCIYTCLVEPKLNVFYRNLSVSTAVGLPSNIALWALANEFGFTGAVMDGDDVTGPGNDWLFEKGENSIFVAQWMPPPPQ